MENRLFLSLDDEVLQARLEDYSKSLHNLSDLSGDTEEKCTDPILRSLIELTDLAVECEQHKSYDDDFQDRVKVCLVRMRLKKKEIESMFGIKPVSVYGLGLFVPIEGLVMSQGFRSKSNYDKSLESRVRYDLSSVPEDVRKSHEFRLTVPAMDGLFIPKKTSFTSWIASVWCIKYLDMTY